MEKIFFYLIIFSGKSFYSIHEKKNEAASLMINSIIFNNYNIEILFKKFE